jgi:crotonobetainyl-CoA:carnitine CoA-transferase CaiB-like acyl-CoA transferase
MKRYTKAELEAKLERIGLPYAPIAKPWDLLADPHLNASGALHETCLPSGRTIHVPGLPIAFDGEHPPKRSDPPPLGHGARAVLQAIGYDEAQIDGLAAAGVIALQAA